MEEAVSPPKERMSYEEFLEWCDEDTWAEWVDGEVIVLSPAGDRHQDLSDWLAFILRAFG
jgi:Uma2 family endonuclease